MTPRFSLPGVRRLSGGACEGAYIEPVQAVVNLTAISIVRIADHIRTEARVRIAEIPRPALSVTYPPDVELLIGFVKP